MPSTASEMKSSNWISGEGMRPAIAAPTIPWTRKFSEIGLSMTRIGPNFS
jgi:hypothetical protein